MQKGKTKRRTTRFYAVRSPWFLPTFALVLVVLSVFFTVALRSQADSVGQTTLPTRIAPLLPDTTPVHSSRPSSAPIITRTPVSTQQPIATLVASTPQTTHYGIFPLSTGGPLPVAETVFRPTNIARLSLNKTLISVYAGSLTHDPQVGVLCVLREDLATGQIHLQTYQNTLPKGALTLLAIQNTKLTLTNGKVQGFFDLATNQFSW